MSDQPDKSERQVGLLIHGRVQGVGFRWWTRRTAESLGVSGSVRNLPDGTVEVRARAARDSLAEFEGRLRRGPPSAAVRRIETFPVDDIRGSGFVIEP